MMPTLEKRFGAIFFCRATIIESCQTLYIFLKRTILELSKGLSIRRGQGRPIKSKYLVLRDDKNRPLMEILGKDFEIEKVGVSKRDPRYRVIASMTDCNVSEFTPEEKFVLSVWGRAIPNRKKLEVTDVKYLTSIFLTLLLYMRKQNKMLLNIANCKPRIDFRIDEDMRKQMKYVLKGILGQ